LDLRIVVGSTREGRRADAVAAWVADRAAAHAGFAPAVLDLRDYPLPMFRETFAAFAGDDGPEWSSPVVHAWNDAVAAGDAFVFVTPEYNHSVPAVLKNAIDSVFGSYAFRNKVAGFVGYSAGLVGGARAVEHLAHIAIEAELVPLRNTVLLASVHEVFGAGREPGPGAEGALRIMLDDLAWWGTALRQARAAGELPPAGTRRVAA
jgi:NAD(P)H-dependent FMN reductase